MQAVRKLIKQYFATHLTGQMKEMYISSSIFEFGVAMVAVFEPIYLWTIGFPLKKIIFFYLVAYAVYFAILPLGGKFARSRGYEHSIALSTPFLIVYYLSLFAIPQNPMYMISAVLSWALFKAFYWPGTRSMLANYTDNRESGRALSGLTALALLSGIIGPVIGGALLSFFGFGVLFVVASVIILVSNIPMLITPEHFTPHDLFYKDAYKRLLRPEFRRTFVAHIGYGEEFITEFIWPVFMLIFIPSYFAIGAVITIGGVLTLVAALVIGSMTDRHHRHPILHAGVIMTAFSWFARLLVVNPYGVIMTQSFYKVSRLTVSVPFLSIVNQKARDYSVMKSSVFYEMSIVITKMATALILIAILTFFSPGWEQIFVVGAILTLFYGFI